MTLADEARTLRERVAARLAELEPLVREYQELQRVADEIGLTASEPASTTAEEPAAPAAAAPQPAAADQQSAGPRLAAGRHVAGRAGWRRPPSVTRACSSRVGEPGGDGGGDRHGPRRRCGLASPGARSG